MSILFLFSNISGNPLRCDCKLGGFVESAISSSFESALANAECHSPPALKGTPLKDVDFGALECDKGNIINSLAIYVKLKRYQF
jgi:hypothetical protein